IGASFVFRPFDRLSLGLDAMGGLAELFFPGGGGTAFSAGLRVGAGLRVSPSMTISASGGFSSYFGTQATILQAFSAGLWLSLDVSALASSSGKVLVDDAKLDAVFPSLYAYYDDSSFGTVRVTNDEDSAIQGVSVSFNAAGYMDQPKVCATFESIPPKGSVEVPVKALFNDRVLDITQGIDAKGEIIVSYRYLGAERTVRTALDFRLHHRNAITWTDDRRAASFVSPKNPAALWFARFATNIVRDRLRGDINLPLQYAIGLFEAERLYGLNYVVVPTNDYSVKHGIKDYIDSVQFPHQTLENRGGDCSDLAILFAALMESVGVRAAFITIPGHIFAAFDTGLDEAAARSTFYDPDLLVYRNGRAWVPVEITMVKDGFNKAWRVAAKEWHDNVALGKAAFYTLSDCWTIYPPASFPGVNPRFNLPGEADEAIAFDSSLDRFVAREIEGKVARLRVASSAEPPAKASNELGILFARYGMLKQAWQNFSDSAKANYDPAWTNLGNVAFLRKDFKLALTYYDYALKANEKDTDALLGKARCEYELEDFESSDADYAKLNSIDSALASRFGYLASIYGGAGRAYSLADRASSVEWAVEAAISMARETATPVAPTKVEAPVSTPTLAQASPAPPHSLEEGRPTAGAEVPVQVETPTASGSPTGPETGNGSTAPPSTTTVETAASSGSLVAQAPPADLSVIVEPRSSLLEASSVSPVQPA
ncbi:MAG TPA: hypothetical protein VMV44_05430, partial [Rectinemataceae bacterium]|nr:hypothetical protein [Rectinemataceae bacterium]